MSLPPFLKIITVIKLVYREKILMDIVWRHRSFRGAAADRVVYRCRLYTAYVDKEMCPGHRWPQCTAAKEKAATAELGLLSIE